MSVNLVNVFAQQFATNVNLLLQQQGSKLRGYVSTGMYVGKQASPVDQIGSISMQPVVGRFQPMGRVDANVDRRWVFPLDYDLPQLIDSFDKLRLLIDPQGPYVQNAVFAAGRQIDTEILNKFNGTNKTGETAGTSTSLATANKVSVSFGGTNTGLTVSKLREARRILMANNVDMEAEQYVIAVKAKQHDNLLAEAQVISSDFNAGAPVMKEGKVVRFLGFDLIHTELCESSGTSDLIPVFSKRAMHLGIWGDVETRISQRNDLQGEPWQAYVKMTIGASRLEENRCVQIACYNS